MTTSGTRPVIPEASARAAAGVLCAIMDGEFDEEDSRVVNQRRMAAEALMRLHLAELRWGAQEIEALASGPRASRDVRDLASLTPEALDELHARMTADYPGKKQA